MSKTTLLAAQGDPFITAGTRLFFLPLTVGRNALYRACVFLPEGFKHLHVPLFAQELDYSQVIRDIMKKICRRLVCFVLQICRPRVNRFVVSEAIELAKMWLH